MTTKAEIGSISTGTMRPEDLIPCFLDELERLDPNHKLVEEITLRMGAMGDVDENPYFATDDAGYDLEELFNAMNELAPEECYFGAHPGDGADYGFWQCEDE